MALSHFTRLITLTLLLVGPVLLIGAAPQWWLDRSIYHTEGTTVPPASDYSPANLGQLKHFAITAYEYLRDETGDYGDITPPDPTAPPSTLNTHRIGGVGWRLRESLRQFVTFNDESAPLSPEPFAITRNAGQIVRKISTQTADYAMLNQGQLKSIATLFYERLDAVYAPYPKPRPWGTENGPAAHSAPVTLGQLKHTFSFDFEADSDGDGISDIDEIHHTTGPGNTPAPTNPFLADTDSDGIPDGEDTEPNDPDRDGDGFLDGEDKWPDDPRRGDYIPPKFFAVTDLTAYLPEEERIGFEVKHVAISNSHSAAFVGIFSHPTETYLDSNGDTVPVTYIRSYVFENGVIVRKSQHLQYWWVVDGATEFKRPGKAPYSPDGLPGSTDIEVTEISFEPQDIDANGVVVGSGLHECTNFYFDLTSHCYRDPDGYSYAEVGFTMTTPAHGEETFSDTLVWDLLNALGVRFSRLGNDLGPGGNGFYSETSFPRGYYEIAANGTALTMGTIFGGILAVGKESLQDKPHPNPNSPDANDAFNLPFLSGALTRFEDYQLTSPPSETQIVTPGATPYYYPNSYGNPKNLASDGSMLFRKYTPRVGPADGNWESTKTCRYLYNLGNGNGYEEADALENIVRMNTVPSAIGAGTSGLHQAILHDPSSHYTEETAYFAWEENTRGNWKKMRLPSLLIWTNKPEGVKDDYDRYFARTPKGTEPAEPQIRYLRPKLITDSDPASAGAVINGVTFPNGVPRQIYCMAEMVSESGSWEWKHFFFELRKIPTETGFDWAYSIRFVELVGPNPEALPPPMEISAINSDGLAVGTVTEQGDGEVIPTLFVELCITTPPKDGKGPLTSYLRPIKEKVLDIASLCSLAEADRFPFNEDPDGPVPRPFPENDGTNFRYNDRDLFHVSLNSPGESVDLKVKIETLYRQTPTATVLTPRDSTEIKMQVHNPSSPPPRSFISKYPAALVANIEDDQVEIGGIVDGAFNDRTLLAALGDTVRISLPASLGRKAISMDLKIPIRWKTKLFPVIVQYANGTNWVDSIAQAKVEKDLDKAKRLYATLGLNLEWDSIRKIHDQDLNVSIPNGIITDTNDRTIASFTERALLAHLAFAHGWKKKTEVAVIYVKEYSGNPSAHAISAYQEAAGNAVMMRDEDRLRKELAVTVLAHELEHIFLQASHGAIGGFPGPYPKEFRNSYYLWNHQEPQNHGEAGPIDGFKKSFRISKRRGDNVASDIVGASGTPPILPKANNDGNQIVRPPNAN